MTRAIAGVAVIALAISGLPVIAPKMDGPLGRALDALVPPAAADPAPAGGEYKSVPAVRLLDTRWGTGGITGPLTAGQKFELTVLGRGGVPSSGVLAVALNVTTVDTMANGYVTVWPAGQPRPGTSTLNSSTQGAVNNLAIVQVGSNGQVSIYNSHTSTDLLATSRGM